MRLFTLRVDYTSGEQCMTIHTSYTKLLEVITEVLDHCELTEDENIIDIEQMNEDLKNYHEHWFQFIDETTLTIQEHYKEDIERIRQDFLDEQPSKYLFEWIQENDMEEWEHQHSIIEAKTEVEAWREFYGQWLDLESEKYDVDLLDELSEVFERNYSYIQEVEAKQV